MTSLDLLDRLHAKGDPITQPRLSQLTHGILWNDVYYIKLGGRYNYNQTAITAIMNRDKKRGAKRKS